MNLTFITLGEASDIRAFADDIELIGGDRRSIVSAKGARDVLYDVAAQETKGSSMRTPNEGNAAVGTVMLIGKAGRGRTVHLETMIAAQRDWPDGRTLDALLADARSSLPSRPHVQTLDQLQVSPAQMIIGKLNGDRERWWRQQYLCAVRMGARVIEIPANGDKHNVFLPVGIQHNAFDAGSAQCGAEAPPLKYFAVDGSRLSCSTVETEV